MPLRVFEIRFQIQDGELPVHRIRNLGEDFWREFQATGLARVHAGKGYGEYDVDHATGLIIIEVKHTRMIGRVKKRVDQLLRQHYFDGKVNIERK